MSTERSLYRALLSDASMPIGCVSQYFGGHVRVVGPRQSQCRRPACRAGPDRIGHRRGQGVSVMGVIVVSGGSAELPMCRDVARGERDSQGQGLNRSQAVALEVGVGYNAGGVAV